MLATRLTKIRNSHLWLLSLPFALWMFCLQMGQATVVYSIKKFSDDASFLALALVLFRLPGAFFSPLASYASDHTWTSWGRRKPYIVASGVLGAMILCFVPGMSSAWGVVGVILGFQVMIYVMEVFNPLSQELVPLPQRGRASAVRAIMFGVSITVFFSVLVGRFDDVYLYGPLASLLGPITGEQFTYWLGAVLMLLTPLLVGLGVTEFREAKPVATAAAPAPSVPRVPLLQRTWAAVRNLVRELCSKQMLGTTIVAFSWIIANSDLQSFSYLLYTEQWGYSKQQMGSNIALGMAIMMPFIFLGGWLSDRFDKTRAMLIAQLAQLAVCLFYIFYVKVWLHNAPPSLLEILVVSEVASITKWIMATMAWPLVFEYAPRDRMGTANAGYSIITAVMISTFIFLMGGWITGYSRAFSAPAGLEARVVLAQPATAGEVRTWVGGGIDVRPALPGPDTGAATRVWSLRQPSPDVDARLAELKLEENLLLQHQTAAADPRRTDAERLAATAQLKASEKRVADLHAHLDARAAEWKTTAEARLAGRLVAAAGASWLEAELPAARKAGYEHAAPVLSARASPLAYDYFSGYYLYALQLLISCGLTLLLMTLERRGTVRRQKVEEVPA